MEKKLSRAIIRATPIICALLLTLLALFYADFYGSKVVPISDQRARRVSRWELSSMEDSESSEVQEFQVLSIRGRGVDETRAEEPDSGETSHKSRKLNETDEEQIFRPQGLGSKETEETQQENKSLKVHQASRAEEPSSTQLNDSTRELNETVGEQMPEHSRSSIGTVKLQEFGEANEMIKEQDSRESLFTRLVRGEDRTKLEATGFACDTTFHSVVCVTMKPVTIDMATMTVHVPTDQPLEPNATVVRPYARQEDEDVLRNVRPVKFLLENTTLPACRYNHDVPAVIFSSSGFTGNLFHEFNEIIIPLFITTYHFQSRVQFILMDYKPTFANKYRTLMSRLSSYRIIDPASNPRVHCFPGAVAGLQYHEFLALNSSKIPGGYNMHSFRRFLRQTYHLKIINVSQIKRPKLLLLSRRRTRRFLNEAEMVRMIKDLGFEVIVAWRPDRMSNLNKFTRVVNSCTVLVGAHGAGLANELFLPDGAVMVQVDLLGLEWGSAYFYGNPAEAMGVHYLRYKVEPEETDLWDIYGRNHTVITDPDSIFAEGYQAGRAVYLDQQNVKVNLVRFRETLLEALRITGFSSTQKQ